MRNIDDIRRSNIHLLEKEYGSLKALADALERSESQVSQWKNGAINSGTGKPRGMRSDTTRYIEQKTGKTSGWMDADHSKTISNVEPGPDLRAKVPLISWVQAGVWCEAFDPLLPGEAERWLDCPVSHSNVTFALRVRGDSMTAPHGNSRTYPEGSIIFVDPERRSPSNGDRVVACLEGGDGHEVTFKIYKNEDGRQWLQPLNPSHEPIRTPFRILGTVLGKWEDG